jgi:hypothetical protein
MKKVLWLGFATGCMLSLLYVAYSLAAAAHFFVEHGRTLVVEVENEYPGHAGKRTFLAKSSLGEVVLETDQPLVPTGQYTLRYLTRDLVGDRRGGWLLPAQNAIRIKPRDAGKQFDQPIRRIELFDEFTVYMWGYVPEGPAPKIPTYGREAAVPWVLDHDNALAVLWHNTPWYILTGLAVWAWFSWKLVRHGISHPWQTGSRADRGDFIHPSLRRIDADHAEPASRPVSYKRSPPVHYPEAQVVDQPLKLPRKPSEK